jgi:hypothetical protein
MIISFLPPSPLFFTSTSLHFLQFFSTPPPLHGGGFEFRYSNAEETLKTLKEQNLEFEPKFF